MPNLDALITPGALPWSPNQGVQDVEVWHAYEHPLTGTFVSNRQVVLFTVIADFDGRLSVWAYTPLTPEEVSDLTAREFGSVDSLRDFIDEFFNGRPVVFALAEDLLVRQWSVPEAMGDLYELALEFVNGVVMAAAESHDPGTALRVKLAQVEAAEDLVDA